jgi:hypothetical protein
MEFCFVNVDSFSIKFGQTVHCLTLNKKGFCFVFRNGGNTSVVA